MSMFRKKKIKFAVELVISRLTDVSLLNARLFAKVRLLDHGSFVATTDSKELRGHTCVLYTPPEVSDLAANGAQKTDENSENRPTTSGKPLNSNEDPLYALNENQTERQPFRFLCRIPYNSETLQLEECRCKISIRKVERANRVPTKLGFMIVNLSEFANSGLVPISKSYLLDGYTGRQRQDNQRVHIAVRMCNQMSDPLIKVPNQNWNLLDESQLNPRDRKASARADDEVRRRCLEEADRIVFTAGTGTAQIPQSATLNSFSSSGSEGSTTTNTMTTTNGSPPLHSNSTVIGQTPISNARFSAPVSASTADNRRISVPVERTSWVNGSTHDFASSIATPITNPAISRRMSDDRITVAATAPPNVPNRIQQTRRDADSVIEEVLAEAEVGLDHDYEINEPRNDDTADSDDASMLESDGKRRLELFVSKRNGDALVLGSDGTTDRRSPRPNHHFERCSVDCGHQSHRRSFADVYNPIVLCEFDNKLNEMTSSEEQPTSLQTENPTPGSSTQINATRLPSFIPMVSDQTPKDYESANAYAEAVRAWYLSSHQWLQCQHAYFVQNNPALSIPQTQSINAASGGDNAESGTNRVTLNVRHRRVLIDRNAVNDIRPEMLRQAAQNQEQAFSLRRLFGARNVNYEQNTLVVQRWSIPPFSRRLIAELIDFFILFLLKMVIVWTLVEVEAIDLDQFDSILTSTADLQTLIDLTQGLFHIEVISKILSGIVEALCLTYGFASYPPGTTPGKFVMNLQVVSCIDIQPVAGVRNQVVVTSQPHISIFNSLIRSLLKNLVTNFLFPVNAFFYAFSYNRSVYDHAASTLVVTRTP
ncbi:RDD domain-containing protein [Aphelenchoides besseyi]|nr:RDD domain-containing protein [Aphelenchoides besseyi]KAI6209926.1 RDD domain-containing protein [Aphelenchoides besseyi]